MGAPINIEIRKRAVAAYDDGAGTIEYVAKLFGVGTASLKRWRRLAREKGCIEPIKQRYGALPLIDENGLIVLKKLCEKQSDSTLPELQALYNKKRKCNVSESTIGRAIRDRLKLNRKKKLSC